MRARRGATESQPRRARPPRASARPRVRPCACACARAPARARRRPAASSVRALSQSSFPPRLATPRTCVGRLVGRHEGRDGQLVEAVPDALDAELLRPAHAAHLQAADLRRERRQVGAGRRRLHQHGQRALVLVDRQRRGRRRGGGAGGRRHGARLRGGGGEVGRREVGRAGGCVSSAATLKGESAIPPLARSVARPRPA